MFVIAGLGNPEARYARHRHNIGFRVVEAFAESVDADPWRAKFNGQIARARAAGQDMLLVRPMTYMNDSGRCIQAVCSFFRVPINELLVVHDELDLPFGTLRLKPGGGHAGHNGLRSIIQYLGRPDFARLRVGIAKPPPGFAGKMADYVLSDFSAQEHIALPDIVDKATGALRLVMGSGLGEASKALNTKPKPPKVNKPQEREQALGPVTDPTPADHPPEQAQEGLASQPKKR